MIIPDRRSKIESFGRAWSRLEAALREFPREMWTYRPDAGDWTIHEIIIHIADAEANGYIRCCKLLAEPGSEVMSYDEPLWARRLRYHERNTADALELFRLLRRQSYDLISDLPEAAWSNSVVHPESGRLSLDDWLDIYERHVPQHIAQMRVVYETWRLERAG